MCQFGIFCARWIEEWFIVHCFVVDWFLTVLMYTIRRTVWREKTIFRVNRTTDLMTMWRVVEKEQENAKLGVSACFAKADWFNLFHSFLWNFGYSSTNWNWVSVNFRFGDDSFIIRYRSSHDFLSHNRMDPYVFLVLIKSLSQNFSHAFFSSINADFTKCENRILKHSKLNS